MRRGEGEVVGKALRRSCMIWSCKWSTRFKNCPDGAEYAIVDSSDNTFRIELRRVPIDSNLLIESALDSGMPNADWWLILRYGLSVKS